MNKNSEDILKISKIKGPPDWFKLRMNAVLETPPLSLQEMQAQFRAGIEQRTSSDENSAHSDG